MKALVVFDSKFGNTRALAEAIGDSLRSAYEVELVTAPATIDPHGVDLLVVGGPTQAHGLSPNLKQSLRDLPKAGRDAAGATFDTRFRMSSFLTGSAAKSASSRLNKAGFKLVAPPESFFVKRETAPDGQQLEAGELDRARQWALGLLEAAGSTGKTAVSA